MTFEFYFGFDFVAAKVLRGKKFSQFSYAGLLKVFIVFAVNKLILDFTFIFDFNRLNRQQCREGPGRPPVIYTVYQKIHPRRDLNPYRYQSISIFLMEFYCSE